MEEEELDDHQSPCDQSSLGCDTIDAEIQARLAPYGLTLDTYLPLHHKPLYELTPLPPGCMDAPDYLTQLEAYQASLVDAQTKLAASQARLAEAEPGDEGLIRRQVDQDRCNVELYDTKLYCFSRVWRPIQGVAFRAAMGALLRERARTVLAHHQAEALRLLALVDLDAQKTE